MTLMKSMDIKELLLQYIKVTQEYEQALRRGSAREANKYTSVAERIFDELKRRGAEKELVPLLSHPRPIVRVGAAAHVLKFDPEPATQVLEELAENGSGTPAVDAMTLLAMWKEEQASSK